MRPDRTVVITGGNSGIGRETALALARDRWRVVILGRSQERTEPVLAELRLIGGPDAAAFVQMDLGSFASVRRGAQELLDQEERIDVLVNNAGVGGQRGVTEDGFELQFGTNHLGHHLLTRLLEDRLLVSAPARVVTVSSVQHYQATGIDWEAVQAPTRTLTAVREYNVSKLANVLFSRELGRRLTDTGVTTYAVHPGGVATNIWRRVPWPIRPILLRGMLTAEEGAEATILCATSSEVDHETGRYYHRTGEREPSSVVTDELAEELWERSEAWVGEGRASPDP